MEYEIAIERTEARQVLVLEREVSMAELGAFVGEAFARVSAALAAAGVQPVGPPIARYDMRGGGLTAEAGFPVPPGTGTDHGLAVRELPATTVAATTHRGSYGTLTAAYQALSGWMEEHGYVPDGRPWEEYLDGPEVAKPRTIVRWPCRSI